MLFFSETSVMSVSDSHAIRRNVQYCRLGRYPKERAARGVTESWPPSTRPCIGLLPGHRASLTVTVPDSDRDSVTEFKLESGPEPGPLRFEFVTRPGFKLNAGGDSKIIES